jgi:superfamily I DNA/RNA helicase
MNQTIRKICSNVLDGHIERMQELCKENRIEDAKSLHAEIKEWIQNKYYIDIVHLEYLNDYLEE